ncbi:hypothetical protein PV08_03537 [Exophiala spinifera]|uniref:Uncharacterized protein n=1 Tax=Exophiala spinifera TaxID=91928 RepID=A0A0D2BJZ5_9EURO|nr:uncharacterized protein PV08_03537 [Exophiala spinifera]KIW19243.1 hypothetical protein PV08_03537 [Exophiala spinifera]
MKAKSTHPLWFIRQTCVSGCSGIGLGLVKHLLSKSDEEWRVVVADLRPEAYEKVKSELDPARHKFIETDVASWDSQLSMVKEAFSWSGVGRIDFFAANAGTTEGEHLLDPTKDDLDADPTMPSMRCTQVNQVAVFYGLKMFLHYARVTNRALKAGGAGSGEQQQVKVPYNPKFVITSSCSALYPFPIAVQYAATKASLVSLVRSIGKNLLASDNVAVNCIMPAYVDTGLTPSEVTALWPPEWVTPLSTMNRAYDELISDDGTVAQDGKSDGRDGSVKAGKCVECVVDRLYYRRGVDFADESQRFCIEESFRPDGVWMRGMMEMVRKGAYAG